MENFKHSLFDRQRSGYTREFRMTDVFIFNLLGFALGLALSTNPVFIGAFVPYSNILIVIILGAILAFFNGLVYGWFGAIMPSTGGDYVFVSRSVSHRIGFLTNWGFTFCQLYGFAANVSWVFGMAIRPSLLTINYAMPLPGWLQNVMSTDGITLLYISLGLIAIFYLVSLLNAKFSRLITFFVFILGMCGPVLMAYLFITHNQQDFISAFNDFVSKNSGQANAYGTVTSFADQHLNSVPKTNVWLDSLKGLPLGFLCFLGFTYSVYAGGEVEKPEKAQVRGILLSLLTGAFFFLLCMGLYVNLVGQKFYAVIGIPDVQSTLGLNNVPLNFLAGILAKDHPTLNIIMQVGNLVWFLLVPYVILQVCTRNLIAWACDEMFPKWYLKRLPSSNSPWAALLVVSLLGMVGVIVIYFYQVSLVGAAALAALAYLFTGYGAFRSPKTIPDAYKKLPRFAKAKIFDFEISFFQLAGLITIAGFGWIIYASVMFPDIAQGRPHIAIIMMVTIYVVGLGVYQWRKTKIKRTHEEFSDFNVDELFKEIPAD